MIQIHLTSQPLHRRLAVIKDAVLDWARLREHRKDAGRAVLLRRANNDSALGTPGRARTAFFLVGQIANFGKLQNVRHFPAVDDAPDIIAVRRIRLHAMSKRCRILKGQLSAEFYFNPRIARVYLIGRWHLPQSGFANCLSWAIRTGN